MSVCRILGSAGSVVALAVILALQGCSQIGSWDMLENLGELGSRRMKLVFDNAAQSSDLHDFPVLVVLDPARTDGYDGFAPDGRDIRFVDPDNPASFLDCEIELWDPAGNSYIWVRVPKIDAGSSQDHIWLYFDNPNLDAGREDPQGVWRAYKLVYHFGDRPVEAVYDSSPGAHHGEPLDAMPALVSARIGLGFPASDSPKRYVHTHYREDLSEWTVEAWVRGDNAPQVTGVAAEASGPVMGNRGYNLGWDHDSGVFAGTVHCRDLAGYETASFGALNGGQWYYLAGVYNSSTPKLQAFKDGVLQDQNLAIGSPLSAMLWDVFIGTSENTSKVLDGIIDEVRICDSVRSEDWIYAQWLSMTDNYIAYGSVEDL